MSNEDLLTGTTKLVVGSSEPFEIGSKLSIKVDDKRWWRKLIHKLLFLGPPKRTKYLKVLDKNITTITVCKWV